MQGVRRSKKGNSKLLAHIAIVMLIGIVTGTSAYLVLKNSVTNEFVVGEVKGQIVETFDRKNKTKTDVFVKNTGNVPSYIKAAVLVSWKDNDGKILETKPIENVDYSIDFSNSENWMKSKEGYYYYKNALDVGENTDVLIEECTQTKEYDDRTLVVTIATQEIQAEPDKAVKEAWDVNVSNGAIVLKE